MGRTVIVTGAYGAFGSRAAKIFAHRDVDTLILVDLQDCTDLKRQIDAEVKTSPKILVWQVDMMSYASCQALAKKASELQRYAASWQFPMPISRAFLPGR